MLAVLHLSTALPKPSAAALKPAAAQMDAALVTKLNSGGWKGPTITELKAEAPFESGCAGWCDNHTTSWEWKCFWSAGVCTTCDECTEWNAPVGPRCEPWCAGHTNDWTTKCSWKSEQCSTCGGCIAPSFPPSPYTPPVPSTPPPPLACADNPVDWTALCMHNGVRTTCSGGHKTGCAEYVARGFCSDGSFTGHFDPASGANMDGVDATQACCACGGGISPAPPSAPPPPPWEYSSAICRSQHDADTFFKNPHLDDCPAGDGGLLMCSQATTVGTLCYYSVGNTCGSAAEAPLQPYSCCVAGNKDATCNGGNVILQVAIPPPSPPSPPLPPYTPPPASFWGAGEAGLGGSFGLNLHGISKATWAPTCASNNPTYNKHQKYYINMGMKTWPECMQLAAEHKMQVNGEAGNSNIYPAWSPIITSDGAGAWGYAGNWPIPRQVEIWNKFYCTLTKNSFGTFPEYKDAYLNDTYLSTYVNDTSSWLVAQVAFPTRAGPLPCKGAMYWNTDSPCTWNQCMHFKYVDVGVVTPYMCQIIAASNGASVLSSSTLGLGNIKTAMPTFHSCNTGWYWDGTNPQWENNPLEGPSFQCYIGYLDHLC